MRDGDCHARYRVARWLRYTYTSTRLKEVTIYNPKDMHYTKSIDVLRKQILGIRSRIHASIPFDPVTSCRHQRGPSTHSNAHSCGLCLNENPEFSGWRLNCLGVARVFTKKNKHLFMRSSHVFELPRPRCTYGLKLPVAPIIQCPDKGMMLVRYLTMRRQMTARLRLITVSAWQCVVEPNFHHLLRVYLCTSSYAVVHICHRPCAL